MQYSLSIFGNFFLAIFPSFYFLFRFLDCKYFLYFSLPIHSLAREHQSRQEGNIFLVTFLLQLLQTALASSDQISTICPQVHSISSGNGFFILFEPGHSLNKIVSSLYLKADTPASIW